jgi:hypothetical protein
MPEREAWQVQYLRIIGRLYRDGRLRLRPSYLTGRAPWTDREGTGESPLEVELVNAGDEVLSRYPLRVYPQCAFGARPQTDAVRGWIPFHPETRRVRFLNRGRLVHQILRSDRSPELRLRWEPAGHVEGKQRVAWDVQAQGNTECFLRYSANGGRTWQRLGLRTKEQQAVVNFDELPGGDRCIVEVVATDGLNTVAVQSPPFAVRPKGCLAIIVGPIDGSRVVLGDSVPFVGQGFWLEGSRVERQQLRWTSSIDGELGTGDTVRVERLSPGQHRITLTAGSPEREGHETITITVSEKPGQDTRA